MQAAKLNEVVGIIKSIREGGIRVFYSDDQLKISSKKGVKVPQELLKQIRDYKTEIIEVLQQGNEPDLFNPEYNEWFDEKSLNEIVWAEGTRAFPVMHQQEKEYLRFLFIGDYGFNLTLKIRFEHFDRQVIEKVFETIFDRHESLRTTFIDNDGVFKQVINHDAFDNSRIKYVNMVKDAGRESALQNLIADLSKHPFNFEKQSLVTINIVHYQEGVYYLLFTLHHVISDETTLNILRSELETLYEAYLNDEPNPLTDVAIQYKEYAKWVNDFLNSEKGKKSKNFYREKILKSLIESGIRIGGEVSYKKQLEADLQERLKTENLLLPISKAYGLIVNLIVEPGAAYKTLLNGNEFAVLKKIAAQYNVSSFTLLVTLMSILFYKIKKDKSLRIYIPYTTRIFEQFQTIVGWLVGEIILCVDIKADKTLFEMVELVNKQITEFAHHRFYPHEKIMSDLDIPLNILAPYHINFIKEDHLVKPFVPEHSVLQHGAHFDLRCAVTEYTDAIEFYIEYKSREFSARNIEAMFKELLVLLKS
ncbi:hypothetical protein INP83_12370 [Mucilaginibacter sp. 21P]|uniref:condensation domain-containing protein n=1 Tax=Mucilaginibacter sp. 21P TaxID=2778902 RepID=UPI001C58F7B4|nr:condensation domain-containing protein [Mucilaginibacter sp. 21P]QXV63899.1 hypothetical protein INP83_12370 [Mucilaginibacter sp. 21P]